MRAWACFFMGAFLAGSIAGLVWSINRTLEIIRDKEENMLGVGIGFRFSFFCWWRYSSSCFFYNQRY